jgi:hypothetical protein
VREAACDPRVWCIAGQQLSIGITNAAVANFMSALFRGFGYDSVDTVLYQLPNGAFQLVGTVAAGVLTSNIPNTTIFTIIAVHLPSIAGIIGVATIDLSHRLALTACCWMLGITGAAIILNWSIIAANFAGHSKRMTVNGVNFVFYAAGNVIGPFLFLPEEAPRYLSAIKALCGIYSSSMFFTAVIGLLMLRENRKRRALFAPDSVQIEHGGMDRNSNGAEDDEDAFRDLTDGENKRFRYRL